MFFKGRKGKVWVLLLASLFLIGMLGVGCEPAIDDEEPAEGWVFATNHEYSARPDGLPGLQEHYGFQFEDSVIMDEGIIYNALRDGEVPVGMGFETDGRIAGFGLVTLEDDQFYHPVYNCAITVRQEVLEEYPEIEDIFGEVTPYLDTQTMQELNAQVDIDGDEPSDAAWNFLLEEGLIGEEAPAADKGPVSVGSKEFTEQLILGKMAVYLLEDAGFEVDDNTALGGTAIVREALEAGDVDLYWEYTGTGWMVILGEEEPLTDPEDCYQQVKERDLEENGVVWLDYTDFNNTYTVMMREDDAAELGIVTVSDLADAINEGVPAP